jgi:site-specific recombinase
MRDLHQLLKDIDDNPSSLASQHLWLIELIDWIRDNGNTTHTVQARITLFLDVIDSNHDYHQAIKRFWRRLTLNVDFSALLADFGFPPRSAFPSALASRLRRKIVPKTPETSNAAEIFELAFNQPSDSQWLASIDQKTLERLGNLLTCHREHENCTVWEQSLLSSITYCASQISAAGYSTELRLKQSSSIANDQTFYDLAKSIEMFRAAFEHRNCSQANVRLAADRVTLCLEIAA